MWRSATAAHRTHSPSPPPSAHMQVQLSSCSAPYVSPAERQAGANALDPHKIMDPTFTLLHEACRLEDEDASLDIAQQAPPITTHLHASRAPQPHCSPRPCPPATDDPGHTVRSYRTHPIPSLRVLRSSYQPGYSLTPRRNSTASRSRRSIWLAAWGRCLRLPNHCRDHWLHVRPVWREWCTVLI